MAPWYLCIGILFCLALLPCNGRVKRKHRSGDLTLWLDEDQVLRFSGIPMEIFVIVNGHVQPFLLDKNFEDYLPNIPSSVNEVKFTWKSGCRKYFYRFDHLESEDEKILMSPSISIPRDGRVPRKPKSFTVTLDCAPNAVGMAHFGIRLSIQTRRGKPLPGTPIRLRLRKECAVFNKSGSHECWNNCTYNNNGTECVAPCTCPRGYMGPRCDQALCFPKCLNGGTCTSPGVCTCPPGYQGTHCEGGICQEKCLNGGKCIQKDTCACPPGFFGRRCEFNKCVVPCLNGGRCRGVNRCRCPSGFRGNHCEITPLAFPLALALKQTSDVMPVPSLNKSEEASSLQSSPHRIRHQRSFVICGGRKCREGLCHEGTCLHHRDWLRKKCNRKSSLPKQQKLQGPRWV